jgi:hypothetical protein
MITVTITTTTEHRVELGGMMKKKRETLSDSHEGKSDDPLTEALELRVQLSAAVDRELQAVQRAVGDAKINAALLSAMTAWRRYVGFSHELAQASGRPAYEIRRSLDERLSSDFLKRRLAGLRHGASLPTVELPGAEILNAIRQQRAPQTEPKIFEGRAEYLDMLRRKGMVEVDNDPYVSQVTRKIFPSLEG